MGLQGRDPNPRLTIKPDRTEVRYHWHKPGDPIFVPHDDDAEDNVGLRWEIVEWTENP